MNNSSENGLELIFKTLYNLFYKLATEYPVTLIFLIILIAGYYTFRIKKINKYFLSKPKEKLPFLVEEYYYGTNTNWSILRFIIMIVEFCFVLFFSLFLLNSVGLKIPEEVFQEKNSPNTKIETIITCEKSVPFGDINVCLPKIDGMTECYSNPILKEKANKLATESMIILGYYLSNATYEKIDMLNEIYFDDYFQITSSSTLKNVRIRTSDLDDIMEDITDGYFKENWSELKKDIEKKFNNYSIGRMILIEKYVPNEKVRAGVLLTKIQGNGEEYIIIGVMNLVQIKERLIFCSYYKNYDGEVSIKKAKAKSDYFMHLMIDENK